MSVAQTLGDMGVTDTLMDGDVGRKMQEDMRKCIRYD